MDEQMARTGLEWLPSLTLLGTWHRTEGLAEESGIGGGGVWVGGRAESQEPKLEDVDSLPTGACEGQMRE
jgi:hypothetical protein